MWGAWGAGPQSFCAALPRPALPRPVPHLTPPYPTPTFSSAPSPSPQIRAVGLVDFPSRAIIEAVQAGVPVVSLSVPYSIADRTHAAALDTAREYSLKVWGCEGAWGG